MTNQLTLIESNSSWRLDKSTRDRGQAGIAAARAVLLESRIQARATALAEGESLELGITEAA